MRTRSADAEGQLVDSAWLGSFLRPMRELLIVLFAASFLTALVATAGTGLLDRGARLSTEIVDVARYLVVASVTEAQRARSVLEGLPRARVVAERGAGDVLAATGVPSVGPEFLVVFELVIEARQDGTWPSSATIDEISGALDVIELNAAARKENTPQRVSRLLLLGLAALFAGGLGYFASVILAVRLGGRLCRAEMGTRIFLGTESSRLWGFLGLLIGTVALVGAWTALATLWLVDPWSLAAGGVDPRAPLLYAGLTALALSLGAFVLGLIAARGAVARAVGLVTLTAWVAVLAPQAAWGGPAATPTDEFLDLVVRPASLVRVLSRELAVCRRGRHLVRKGFAGTQRQALLASARGDEVLFRLASLKRAEDLAGLRRWEKKCGALREERRRVRDRLRLTRLAGPSIAPRRLPVQGEVGVAWGRGGLEPGTSGFRNGVGLRTRSGESVRAVAAGRVAYVGELPGMGPVVVLNHGRRTYSVYARVAAAVASVGEEVEVGQTVARAQLGLLYFSIRSHGRSVAPLEWVRSAPRSPGDSPFRAPEGHGSLRVGNRPG